MISGRQIAAARALVGKSQKEIAEQANISIPTLKRMEASEGAVAGLANNVAAIRTALETAGITFLDNGEVSPGPGVALRQIQAAGS